MVGCFRGLGIWGASLPRGLWFLAFLVVGACACQRAPLPELDASHGLPAVGLASPGANLILVSIDTLRADRLGCYGCAAPTSPEIDRFRTDAVLFETAISQAPSTLASHASMFTSLIPSHHGASYGTATSLPDRIQTIAEELRDAGYATAAFTGAGQLSQIFGVAQGFSVYEEPRKEDKLNHTVDAATQWLESGVEQPFFLFLHTYEVHHPYTPDPSLLELVEGPYDGALPPEISKDLLDSINSGARDIDSRDLAHIVACYDAEIRSADQGFGRLVAYLRAADLYDDALIVLTSDHGEEFGEHGAVGEHSHTLYDELLKVPLLVKFPHQMQAGHTVATQVRLLDLAPTISAVVGIEANPQFEGVDLRRVLRAHSEPELAAVSQQDSDEPYRHSTLRTGKWKLYPSRLFGRSPFRGESFPRRVKHRVASFFKPYRLLHLVQDPGELHDVNAEHRELGNELLLRLRAHLESRRTPAADRVTVDEATEAQLEALGYVQ